MDNSYIAGIRGEELAEKYLVDHGMTCLEKRHREKPGEIDLIMEQGETLVFVEVKACFSGSGEGRGLRKVDAGKQRKITKCALIYLMRHGWLRRSIRFDVVEVNQNGIIHVPNAFQPGGMMF